MLSGSGWSKRFWLILSMAVLTSAAIAQLQIRTERKEPPAEDSAPSLSDTTTPQRVFLSPPPAADTGVAAPATTSAEAPQGGVDTVVFFAARDTVLFVASERRLRLSGEARIAVRQQELTADVIELWLDTSELAAEGNADSSGHLRNPPVFREGEQTYRGERIRYSFRTRRGIVTNVSTHMDEGFYSGERLKQVEPGTFFVQFGCYTTCDAEHPHFRFCAPRMKLITGESVFASPVFVYVADIPVLVFPFGLFFPSRAGRQSGVLTPSFFFSATGGLVVENFGYFYAPSDYWDVQLRVTLRTRQGAVFHTLLRYALRGSLEGNLQLSGGWTRTDLDAPWSRQWNITWQHRQRITPQWDLQANVRLSSPDYFRQVATDIQQRVLESLLSTVSSSYVFESGASLSLALSSEQNLLTRAHSGTLPQLSLTLPTWMPLRQWYEAPEWLRQTTVDYSFAASWQYQRDAAGVYSHRTSLVHRPSLRVSPRVGFFTIVPSLSYEERWYFRQLRQWMRPEDSVLVSERSAGFFREYSWSAGISVSTRLYGVADLPRFTGLQALRHVLQPTVGVFYTPAFPQFYATYTDYRTGTAVTYSRFALDGGGFAPNQRQLRFDYRFLNSFEVKPLSGDTAPAQPLELFRFAVAGSYNPLADSLKWSELAVDFSIPALRLITVQGRATGTLYSEALLPVASGSSQWRRIDRFRIADGLFPIRWTSVQLQADMSVSGQLQFPSSAPSKAEADWFGQQPTPIALPPLSWQLRWGVTVRYDEPLRGQISRSAAVQLGVGLTWGGWDVRADGNIDVLSRQLLAPVISIVRQLHCWELRFQWYPVGTFRGYWLRFSPKASVLRELKYEEKTIPGL